MPETFLARFPVSLISQPKAEDVCDTENSRRMREKSLVPRVVRWVRKVKKIQAIQKSVIILLLDPNRV